MEPELRSSASRRPEGPTRVAFQGERGSFSEEAMGRLGLGEIEPLPRRSCLDVARSVESGQADTGLLALENTLAGTVAEAYEAILACPSLHVVDEVVIPIHHCLLALPGTSLESIRSVASHPVALAQCGRFLELHPWLAPRAEYDTAGAARLVAEAGDASRAAIASRAAAEYHALEILAAGIEDRADNQTRFAGIATSAAWLEPGLEARSIVVLTTPNRPGALLRVLQPFAEAGINLSKLESRPTGEPWTYRFIIELDHAAGSEAAAHALEQVREVALSLRLVGTFRRARTAG